MLSKLQTLFSLVFLSVLSLMLPSVAYAGSCYAVAGNLVVNCGFETGDFTGWTGTNLNVTGVVTAGFDGFNPNSGTYFAALGNVGSDGILSQTQALATVVGQAYDISFYLASDGGTPSDFSASFGSTLLLSLTNTPPTGYILYSFIEVATSTSTTLTFTERNDPSYWAFDDISVAPVGAPEPGVLVLFLISMMGLAVLAWRVDSSGASSMRSATAA
jgi:hypothetical protein